MGNLDLVTTAELLEEIAKRQDAKEITYLFAIATDDGEGWDLQHNMFDEEQLQDVCDLLMSDEGWEITDE